MSKIDTILGEMDEELLEKFEGKKNNDVENTTWVEYRLKGQPAPVVLASGDCGDCQAGICKHIHRSVDMTLKIPVTMESSAASL